VVLGVVERHDLFRDGRLERLSINIVASLSWNTSSQSQDARCLHVLTS
jgi:hypothetical protein